MSLSLIFIIFMITAYCAEASVARVVTLRGSVDLIRNRKTISSLHVGDTLETGDVLKTGDGSALKLLFSDRTIVDLGSKSEFKVNQFLLNKTSDRKVDLELVNGKMRTSVNEKVTGSGDFKVKTKSIVMGVRGTEFVVESVEATGPVSEGLGQTQITVLEGSVAVQSQAESPGAGSIGNSTGATGNGAVTAGSSGATVSTQAVSLTAGQQMNSAALASSGNGAPAPVVQNLSSDQSAKVSQTATVSDRSFQMAVNLEPIKENRSETKSESRAESKGENKSGPKSGGPDAGTQKGPSTQNSAPPAPPPALVAVIQNVATIAAAAPPPMIDMGSMKTPGAANDTQSMPPPNISPINMTIGQPVKVNVTFGP